ncbi:hypothetical protein RM704_07150 [Streptomyces sp. DSM 3412]|nr:hypothetical protein [Streptomyces sp. DSM 3412]MDT0567239.1 hypothetical protein [Streptomyces sp. DSM 3412]
MAQHLDPDELTDLALGPVARPTPGQHAHLARCPACRDELDQLRRVVRAARTVSTDDLLTAPPDEVWRSISAELESDTAPHRQAGSRDTPPVPGRSDGRDGTDETDGTD